MKLHPALTFFSLLSLVLTGTAFAQNSDIAKTLTQKLGNGLVVESVTKTPYAGLYEVKNNGELVYTDKEGKYIFVGRIIEVDTKKDLTQERMSELNRVDFKTLPLEYAIKYTKGKGERVIALFEDPNCGYCKKFRKTIQEMDNITVYTFALNILSADSKTKSRDIWCAPNRSTAWDEWMLSNKLPAPAQAECKDPSDQVTALAKKHRVVGTPTVIFADGLRLPGYVDAKTLEQSLAKAAL